MTQGNQLSTNGAQASTSTTPRRKALQSGFSLLARGEPQIWFTGGMLAICLAMIASLMTLILAAGLPTFWPQPVDWLTLRSGELNVGELQSVQATKPKSNVRSASDDGAVPLHSTSGGTQNSAGTSFYYRTENFDLSNEHYRWFTPAELQPEGIARVPEVTLVERMEWGFLYGFPLRIQERLGNEEFYQRELVGQDYESLLQQMNAAGATATSGNSEAMQIATDAMRKLMAQERNESLRRQLRLVTDGVVQVQVVDTEHWQSAQDLSSESLLREVQIVTVDRKQQLQRLSQILPRVAAQRRQLNRLKYRLSKLDAQINQARVAVRQAELDSNSVLPLLLDESHHLIEQLVQQDVQRSQVENAKQIMQTTLEPTERDKVLEWLEGYVQGALEEQRTAIEAQLIAWRQPLDASPQILKNAVSLYEQRYRDVLAKKYPLQSEIDRLKATLAQGDFVVAVPNRAQRLEAVANSDGRLIVDGQLAADIVSRLEVLGLKVKANSARQMSVQGAASLVSFEDAQQLTHVLCAVDTKYARDASPAIWLLHEHVVPLEQLVRVVAVNELSMLEKFSVYFSRWKEFLAEEPREANTLGGVFPAICGTIAMTFFMTIAVVPFGVLAALYLREYTRGGPIVSIIRISINNLAGVPSIVYGVFGFSFFCMTIGSFIDGGPAGAGFVPWPSGIWFGALGIAAILGTVAFFLSFLGSGPAHLRSPVARWFSTLALFLWLGCLLAIIGLIAKSPFFEGFYAAHLPNPTFGKGGLLWAALTLSLLTLPVVIVATEEALAAVPNSLREGSLACGASKWQTIRRIVLPHARPGILTGAILAMARGAGEVAPLMLVGALPNAPELPLDGEFPFFHGSRNFMHLGYQIYSLGFQSQNSEAAKPMVFTCTLLLIAIVAALNISAIFLRSRLRRRFQGNQF